MLDVNPPFSMPFLKAAETEETFFARVGEFLPPLSWQYKLIKKAYDYALEACIDVTRADGSNYFEHLRAVALILLVYLRIRDHELIIAALLHDIVEDRPDIWSIERVRAEFGERVAMLVQYLTKPPATTRAEKEQSEAIYHGRFAQAPREFFLIKLPDRLHNVLTFDGVSAEKRKRKIRETMVYYLPYAAKHLILLHELEEALRAARRVDTLAQQ
jgi:guanosine-3',5'-bis(diphosphate) 3'-pyrophosphohydrolase